jgi:hypothetical protein
MVGLRYWIGYLNVRPALPDLNAADRWTLIKQYRGPLDREHGEIVVRVYVYGRPYLQMNDEDYEVAQNRIDLHDSSGKQIATFMWQGGRVVYAGGWCEILDINQDGNKEFLLFDDRGRVRVVSYESGRLQFKDGFGLQNRIDSAGFQIGPLDLNEDGQLEFLEEEFFPQDINARAHAYFPKVKHWNPRDGFHDVSAEFPKYYEQTVIPELKDVAAHGDYDTRYVNLQAIEYIETNIVKHTPKASQSR